MIRLPFGQTQPIGLDLGSDCIKMIQFEPTGEGLRVCAAAQYYFPPDLPPDSPDRRDLAVKAVRRMRRQRGFRGGQVVLAVADSELVIKTIRVPEGGAAEVAQAIRDEAAKRLPFDIAEATIQHLEAGRVQQGNDVCREVILLAVRNQDIDGEIELLTEMGLEPVSIDVGPCSLFRCCERFLLRQEDRGAVTLLVDIGATSTKVVIGHGPDIVFIKTMACGGRDINRAVARSLDLSARETVNLRESLARGGSLKSCEQGAAPDENGTVAEEVVKACEPVLTQLAKEISLCLRYHAVTFRGYRPAGMQLSGGEARHPLTIDYLSRTLGLPVTKADPLKNMSTSHVDIGQNRRQVAPCWMLSTGLALRGLIAGARAAGGRT
jgi:type IV pilus assembly protein PilM